MVLVPLVVPHSFEDRKCVMSNLLKNQPLHRVRVSRASSIRVRSAAGSAGDASRIRVINVHQHGVDPVENKSDRRSPGFCARSITPRLCHPLGGGVRQGVRGSGRPPQTRTSTKKPRSCGAFSSESYQLAIISTGSPVSSCRSQSETKSRKLCLTSSIVRSSDL